MRWTRFRGRYVLLNLWATWCAPCVTELPALARLQALRARAEGGGGRLTGHDTPVDAAGFLKEP